MIAFDLQAVQSRSHGERGIARFCLELARAIEAVDPDHVDRYVLNPALPIPASVEPLLRTGKVVPSSELWHADVDLLHLGSPVELALPVEQLIVGNPRRVVAQLYDVIPLIFPDRYLADPATSARYRARMGVYLAADAILTDSQSAADDAVRVLGVSPGACRVIGAGTSEIFTPPVDGVAESLRVVREAHPTIEPGYVLLPSGIDWRKNIDGVIEAYGALDPEVRDRHQLVLVCRALPDERRALEEMAARHGCADRLVITGFVPDDVLVALNQAAELVVFPSRYEGFGLPVLEARRCGAPVICGDNSSLREVLPDPAARFDADDADDIHRVLDRALTDAAYRDGLRAAPIPPFTWARAAELTIEAHHEVLARRRPVTLAADRRPRIAYVTPLPPLRSGVADYSRRLLAELARDARVRCFSDQPAHEVEVPDGASFSPLADLWPMVSAGSFDHVVVALGNNRMHAAGLDWMRAHPGVAVAHLHDVRLTNLYADARWPAVVAEHYPGRFSPDELAVLHSPWSEAVFRRTVLLLRDVVDSAASILVHSQHAAELVRLDTGAIAEVVGPLGADDPTAGAPREPEDLVVSFGIVSPVKQSGKVADAARILVGRRPGLRVAFVGEGVEHLGDLPDGVVATGYTTPTWYRHFAMRARVAVQLRDVSNGESSAAVAECLAAGIPTIVTDLGSASELPDDAVVKVDRNVTAPELAGVIERLLDDPAQMYQLAERGRRHARSSTFRDAAHRLLVALEHPAGVAAEVA